MLKRSYFHVLIDGGFCSDARVICDTISRHAWVEWDYGHL